MLRLYSPPTNSANLPKPDLPPSLPLAPCVVQSPCVKTMACHSYNHPVDRAGGGESAACRHGSIHRPRAWRIPAIPAASIFRHSVWGVGTDFPRGGDGRLAARKHRRRVRPGGGVSSHSLGAPFRGRPLQLCPQPVAPRCRLDPAFSCTHRAFSRSRPAIQQEILITNHQRSN